MTTKVSFLSMYGAVKDEVHSIGAVASLMRKLNVTEFNRWLKQIGFDKKDITKEFLIENWYIRDSSGGRLLTSEGKLAYSYTRTKDGVKVVTVCEKKKFSEWDVCNTIRRYCAKRQMP